MNQVIGSLESLKATDPEVYQAISDEEQRQREKLLLIASENFASPAVLAAQGRTDLLFVPGVDDIYPHGTETSVSVDLPTIADDLCGRSRPGHFKGVTSVVLRFLNIVTPDVLVLGRKDYQQMILIGRMIDDLQLDVELVPGDIVREPDGLAMSSRNRYLTEQERETAPALHAALESLAEELRNGDIDFAEHRDAALEALPVAGVLAELSRQHLDGYISTEAGIAGAIDLAHTAGAQQRDDLVTAQAGAWLQCHLAAILLGDQKTGSSGAVQSSRGEELPVARQLAQRLETMVRPQSTRRKVVRIGQ